MPSASVLHDREAEARSRPGARGRSGSRGRSARTRARAPRPAGRGRCPRRGSRPGAATTRTRAAGRRQSAARSRRGWRRPGASDRRRRAPAPASGPPTSRRDAEVARLRLVAPQRLVGDRGQVDRLAPDAELRLAHPGEVEQVADEPLQPLRLGDDRRGRLVGGQRALVQTFRVAADGGQRRLQLVADREQERLLRLASLGELDRDLVEALGQERELARALHRDGRLVRRRRRGRASPPRRAAPAGRWRGRAGTRSAPRAPRPRPRRRSGPRRAGARQSSSSSPAAGA